MPSARTLLALSATLGTLAGGLAVADAAQAPVIEQLTDGPGTDAEKDAEFKGESADGRRIFFTTDENLAATDTDTQADIYARDADGTLTHLTDNPIGADANEVARFGAVSADGTLLIFSTNESLAATDTDSEEDVYRREANGTLTHLTDDPTGADGTDPAGFTSASADGTRVAFITAESLAATDTDTTDDVYVRNADGSLSHATDNTTGPDAVVTVVGFGTLSADGSRVFFDAVESLAATDTDSAGDTYALNANGSLSHISDDPTGPDAEVPAAFAGVSKDGTRAFFTTDESLATTDTDALADVYRRDGDGTLVHVSDTPTGPDAAIGAGFSGMSDDGTRAIIATNESLATSDTDSTNDLYRRDADGTVTHLSDDPGGADLNVSAFFKGVSADGGRVFFHTDESLASTDTDSTTDVYARNADDTLSHLSDDPTGSDAAEVASFGGASADGARVFLSTDEPMAATDNDSTADIYAREADGSLTHMTDTPTGSETEIGVSFTANSADGARMIFFTQEKLLATDTDGAIDLYVARPAVPAGPGGGEPSGSGPAGSGPAGGGPGGSTQDLLAPAFTGAVTAGPATFRLGSLLPRLTRTVPTGTTLRFTLSEAARVTLTFQRALPGRRVDRRCVKPTRANRLRARCTRFVTQGTLALNARKGANRVRFQGRLSRTRRLGPGRYRIVLGAVDAAGNRSRTRAVSVTILPALPPR